MSKWVKHWGKQKLLFDASKTSMMLSKIRKALDNQELYKF